MLLLRYHPKSMTWTMHVPWNVLGAFCADTTSTSGLMSQILRPRCCPVCTGRSNSSVTPIVNVEVPPRRRSCTMEIDDNMNSMEFELSLDLNPEMFSTDAEALLFPTLPDERASRNVSNSSSSVSKSVVTPSEDSSNAVSLTGRPPIQLYLSCDDTVMTPYQVLARRQMEFFEANVDDVESNAQGRNKPIVLGQVGIRCRHCNHLPPKQRKRGAVYYPAKLEGVYQAAHNMALSHFTTYCETFDESLRNHLIYLRENKAGTGGGKSAWAERAGALCIFEDTHGLRFEPKLQYREEIERLEI